MGLARRVLRPALMRGDPLRERSYQFALTTSRAVNPLFRDAAARDIAHQLFRSAWGVASNMRVTKHARSNADFASKMSVVAEEAEESAMWFEALRDLGLLGPAIANPLHGEAQELTAIAVASVRTARSASRWRLPVVLLVATGFALAHFLPISFLLFAIHDR